MLTKKRRDNLIAESRSALNVLDALLADRDPELSMGDGGDNEYIRDGIALTRARKIILFHTRSLITHDDECLECMYGDPDATECRA